MASLCLAPVWAFWHLPLIGSEFPLPIVAPFVLSVLGGTLFQTWLWNRTRGSLLLQMLLHATVNTFGAGILFAAFSGTAKVTLWWIYGSAWLLTGAVAIMATALRAADKRPAEELRPRITPAPGSAPVPSS